jgi:CTP:molybdopterin cytidylyltransferase MocA
MSTAAPLAVAGPVAAIILAAGAGQRLGGRPKGLLQRDGQPLLARQIGLMAQAGARAIVVVLGHHAPAYLPVLEAARANLPRDVSLCWTENPDPDGGTASSLRRGLAQLPLAIATILVALVDQPLLQTDDVRAVLRAWAAREPGTDLLLPAYHGQLGHPVAFGCALRQIIQQETTHGGVRAWRQAHPERVQVLNVTHPRHTLDIDCEADLAALVAEHGVQLR